MRLIIVTIFLSVLFPACTKTPSTTTCDPLLLTGFNKGEMTGEFNSQIKSFSSYFRYLGAENKRMSFLFNNPHSSFCHNVENISIQDSVLRILNTTDTIFLSENNASFAINFDYDVTGAYYQPDILATKNNWLIINSINEDTTEINGQFNLNLVRVFPDTTDIVTSLDKFIVISNARFTSELK